MTKPMQKKNMKTNFYAVFRQCELPFKFKLKIGENKKDTRRL